MPPKQQSFFRTMTTEEYKVFSGVLKDAPQPKKEAAAATAAAVERQMTAPIKEFVVKPVITPDPVPAKPQPAPPAPRPEPEVIQEEIAMPKEIPWRMVGELYNSYIIVEQGEEAFLIDKHAAHERILFEKLKANQEAISSQMLLAPVPVRLNAEGAAELLANKTLLQELGFEIDEFGDNTVLLRQIPMDLSPDMAAEAAESLAADLLSGRRESASTVRDELLHTVACKAAIKAGWDSDEAELLVLVKQVMAREDLKYCPHGRPICVTLSKKQLEKQFKRS
jgi:DNA mismatch repair protein MutL